MFLPPLSFLLPVPPFVIVVVLVFVVGVAYLLVLGVVAVTFLIVATIVIFAVSFVVILSSLLSLSSSCYFQLSSFTDHLPQFSLLLFLLFEIPSIQSPSSSPLPSSQFLLLSLLPYPPPLSFIILKHQNVSHKAQ